MYEDFFGLRQLPFGLNPDPQFLYFSPQHREALAQLLYGLKGDSGFIVLSGEVGTGKTTLLRELDKRLGRDVNVSLVANPMLTPKQMLASCCDGFQLDISRRATQHDLFTALTDHFVAESKQGHNSLIVIDEAQDTPLDSIEQLRLLTNIEVYGKCAVQILLCGQNELGTILDLHEMRQVQQRVVARFHLSALPVEAVQPYIAHRLAVVGASADLFGADCYPLIERHSRGVPRLINQICHRSMLVSFSEQRTRVRKAQVKLAIQESSGVKLDSNPLSVARAFSWMLVVLLLAVVAALVYVVWQRGGGELAVAPVVEVNDSVPVVQFDFVPASEPYDFAAQALFARWQLDYDWQSSDGVCTQAAEYGLSCIEARMSAAELLAFNRPALVHSADGWQAWLEYGAEGALLARDGVLESDAGFADGFVGESLVLVRQPPGWEGRIAPSSSGFSVFWLVQQLGKTMAVDLELDDDLSYSSAVADLVRDFQSGHGLGVSGVFDRATLLRLNEQLFPNTPRLTDD